MLIAVAMQSLDAQVQIAGTPFIRNFELSKYKAGFQTWSIELGDNEMMYFANNNGLLEYDGNNWEIYPLPNNSIIRAICKGNDGVLYSGGFNEIGYFELGEMGGATFHSLRSLVPEKDRDFGDVWKIFVHPDGIVFQTFSQLMFYKDGKMKVIHAPSSFHFSFLANGEYYVDDLENGLMRYSMGELFPLVGMDKLKGIELWSVIPLRDKLLIATASEGIYLYDGNSLVEWKSKASEILKETQVYSVLKLSDSSLAFGTIQNGLLICDLEGNQVQQVNREDGLQNNTILCMKKDQYGNLWLGADHGIDYVEINSPLSQLSYNYGLSTGYAAIIKNGLLYLGTNQGLFVKSMTGPYDGKPGSNHFELINETRGQVWSLSEIDNVIFCGHNNGTFLVDDKKAGRVSDVAGGWAYLQVPSDSRKVIGGSYSGLILFRKENGQWRYIKRIEGFSESSRSIAFDQDGSLWMAHGLKGIFHLWLNRDFDSVLKVDFYNSANSVLPDFAVNLSQTKSGIIFYSGEKTFRFNSEQKKFEPIDIFSEFTGGEPIRSLKEDDKGNYWYFTNNKAGVLRKQEDGSFNNINLPYRHLEGIFVNGFEFVYPYDNEFVLFGAANGFVHYNPAMKKEYSYSFKTYLRTMQTFYPDSVMRIDPALMNNMPVLDYKNNGVAFSFSANDFENTDQMLFSTRLDGYELMWTEWQPRSSREFTNLEEGDYIFSVKAKNIYGTVTEPVSIGFRVLPPFQRTIAAYVIYMLIFLGCVVLFLWWIKKRFERSRIRSHQQQEELFRKKEEILQREALEAEKQLIRMRNDNLKEEMVKKDKELANATMQMLQKNKTMINIKNELNKIAGSFNSQQKYEIQHLFRKINKEIDNENQWKVFETHFENVHEAFLTRIKSAFPNLTPRELKLCAYLRMNISSKEISVLMNISTRGVEISRYRLRKKFNLDRDANLTDFILTI